MDRFFDYALLSLSHWERELQNSNNHVRVTPNIITELTHVQLQ